MVMGLRWLGMLQMSEIQAFDHLMRRRPYEQPDERLLLIQATPEDMKAQAVKPQQNASLSEQTLTPKELLHLQKFRQSDSVLAMLLQITMVLFVATSYP